MPENDLDLLIRAAHAAGEIGLKHFQAEPEVWDKPEDAGPVTEADLAVDKCLQEMLLGARPDYGWLSEETEDNTDRLSKDRVFIIDPIDGTRSFIAGDPYWAHSLAVVENGRPTAAVVYLPAHDALYCATAEGAFLNGTPLQASTREELDEAAFLVPKPALSETLWTRVPPVKRHFRPSLAYRMAMVGEGRFDGMMTLRPVWEWDIAAGALIASVAGASVSDQRGRELIFNSPGRKLDGLVATSAALHPQILALRKP